MWEFYLASSELAFRYSGLNNCQIQLTKHQHALPVTRNYMIEEEDRLRAIDSQLPRLKSIPAS
jgi:cyclopropane-fatty-acyl-phospholipid synthase